MGKPKTSNYASEAELSWFKLSNYAGLLGRIPSGGETQRDRAACYRQWSLLIRDRVELMKIWASGESEYVNRTFERIKQTPVMPLGFERKYSGVDHQSNTTSVKAITSNRIKWLNAALLRVKASPESIADLVLADDAESTFGDYSHLMVNVNALESQILDDFKRWLDGRRSYTTPLVQGDYRLKIERWCTAQLLPFMDLHLFTQFTGKSISVDTRHKLLVPGFSIDGAISAFRKLRDMRDQVFISEIADAILHLAEGDERAIAEENDE